MAIFRRDNNEASKAGQPLPVRPDDKPVKPVPSRQSAGSSKATLVAVGSRFEGTLSGSAELLIEGEVHGHVKPDNHVEIGSQGKVVGDITAGSARISGHVVGNVVGRQVVELTDTGRLEGDVSAPRVIIAQGAFFRGNVQMGDSNSIGKSGSAAKNPAGRDNSSGSSPVATQPTRS